MTGTGKTFTMAGVIERVQKPTLVIAPNKSLAAQLANEFREFFPENAVEYFVSYYDYYQPEAYVPQTDTYIEKDSSINDEIERLRHSATAALLTRRDVIIVASVSCIYGLGTPEEYMGQVLRIIKGVPLDRDWAIKRLVDIQYQRTTSRLRPGPVPGPGRHLEVLPAYDESIIRIELWGDTVERIMRMDPLTGEVIDEYDEAVDLPGHPLRGQRGPDAPGDRDHRGRAGRAPGHPGAREQAARGAAPADADQLRPRDAARGGVLQRDRELLAAHRRPDGRASRSLHAPRLLPEATGCACIDESHVTVPQLHGMYEGDMSRKRTLVEFGFRLPSAMDNRPLRFDEFTERVQQVVFMSATPSPYELRVSSRVVEQIVRPTGLIDPEVEVRPTKGQIDDLIEEIRRRVEQDQRVLVTTLTKKMAEDLTDYLIEMGLRVRYLHSEVDTVQRIEILRDLRLGEFDVLVGINLLREGLDLPEVSLVAILDADKEGFLRSETSLIQTIGRAARNVDGTVLMYADTVTDSMRIAISETQRRRQIQMAYNDGARDRPADHPQEGLGHPARHGPRRRSVGGHARPPAAPSRPLDVDGMPREEIERLIQSLEEEMHEAAKDLRFEYAARLRDEVQELRRELAAMRGAGVR